MSFNDVTPLQWIAAALFVLAVLHTFSTAWFERLSHRYPNHAGVFHLLGEVEVVFGFWAFVLVIAMLALAGKPVALDYLNTRNFTEPMFVFVIMVIAASKPIIAAARWLVGALVGLTPVVAPNVAFFVLALTLVPMLGSFITEPAAMTLAALMLAERVFRQDVSTRLKYATLAVLFVNVSIGGTLTPYAAPPVLMVAAKWGWDFNFMISHFGYKAALAVVVNALVLTTLFRRELLRLPPPASRVQSDAVPLPVILVHLLFLAGVVVFAHYPPVFMGLFMAFLGFTHAYQKHQSPLMLREALLVAFFLGGLVVLGGMQAWWLQPALMAMSETQVFFGALGLTAITDNAALTYLASLVEGLSPSFQYAVVAGAVAGGGLTVIANAPNPAGLALLRKYFPDQAVQPGLLLLAALPPTIVAVLAFRIL